MLSKKYLLLGLLLCCGVVQASENQRLAVDGLAGDSGTPFLIPQGKEIQVRELVIGNVRAILEGGLCLGKQNFRDVALEPNKTYRLKAKRYSMTDGVAYRMILDTKEGGKLQLSDDWEEPYLYEDKDVSPPEPGEGYEKVQSIFSGNSTGGSDKKQQYSVIERTPFISPNSISMLQHDEIPLCLNLDNRIFWIPDGLCESITLNLKENMTVYEGPNPTFEISTEPGTYLLRPAEGTYEDQRESYVLGNFEKGAHLYTSCPWTIEPHDESKQLAIPSRFFSNFLEALSIYSDGIALYTHGRNYVSEDLNVLPFPGTPGLTETIHKNIEIPEGITTSLRPHTITRLHDAQLLGNGCLVIPSSTEVYFGWHEHYDVFAEKGIYQLIQEYAGCSDEEFVKVVIEEGAKIHLEDGWIFQSCEEAEYATKKPDVSSNPDESGKSKFSYDSMHIPQGVLKSVGSNVQAYFENPEKLTGGGTLKIPASSDVYFGKGQDHEYRPPCGQDYRCRSSFGPESYMLVREDMKANPAQDLKIRVEADAKAYAASPWKLEYYNKSKTDYPMPYKSDMSREIYEARTLPASHSIRSHTQACFTIPSQIPVERKAIKIPGSSELYLGKGPYEEVAIGAGVYHLAREGTGVNPAKGVMFKMEEGAKAYVTKPWTLQPYEEKELTIPEAPSAE